MARPPEEQEFVREMRARRATEGPVFWHTPDVLAVFDAETAQKANAANFRDMTLPERLADLVRGRAGDPFTWKAVRSAWMAQLRHLSGAEGVGKLAERMAALLDERLDRSLDLVWAVQEVCTRSLVPIVVEGLSPADTARVLRDQNFKLKRLLTFEPTRDTVWKEVRAVWIQVSAGSVVRRELRGRAAGRRPRRLDLTDPVVDMLPELGIDRAVDSVTAVLTAIAGPPGSAAAAMVWELVQRPELAERLATELGPIPPSELHDTHAAPETHRFVKEALRMWSPPIFLTRPVRTDIDLGEHCLKEGQRYFVSPYLIHHDARHWKDAETFDPDRWKPEAEHGPCHAASYVPFGWAPTTCIGASLGTSQLMLLCQLLCTRYRVELAEPENLRMALAAVPLPMGFRGTISRR
ncbi:MAG TPA: cytochrome P450 [Thermoanaerobaculia bacterium]|nr:cytochrome P450 [Thermoanaerobaculia bacterium]